MDKKEVKTPLKEVKIGDFLEESECKELVEIYKKSKAKDKDFVQECVEFLTPKMTKINEKIGQENDPLYMSYVFQWFLGNNGVL
jgi:hypothetical protein